jgi:hypothetical protein
MSQPTHFAYSDEYGFIQRFMTAIDATGVNTVVAEFKHPDGTFTTKTLSPTTTPADGDYQWTVEQSFWKEGVYMVWVKFTWTGTKVVRTKFPFVFRISAPPTAT